MTCGGNKSRLKFSLANYYNFVIVHKYLQG
jgi:hypothetical protein